MGYSDDTDRDDSVRNSYSRHVGGVLCCRSRPTASFVLANCYVWNLHHAQNIYFFHIILHFYIVKIPPTWRRGYMLTSVTSLHPCAVLSENRHARRNA